ncbi:hypothetical protein TNCV_4676721 [Trichonephila clavipes]|nr:hypothetical protein TNCV_4676721 [Trichonephila clavipes]
MSSGPYPNPSQVTGYSKGISIAMKVSLETFRRRQAGWPGSNPNRGWVLRYQTRSNPFLPSAVICILRDIVMPKIEKKAKRSLYRVSHRDFLHSMSAPPWPGPQEVLRRPCKLLQSLKPLLLRWIVRDEPVVLPPSFPDLDHLDFFFLGHLKSFVYETLVTTAVDLTERIVVASADITSTSKLFEGVRQHFDLWLCPTCAMTYAVATSNNS